MSKKSMQVKKRDGLWRYKCVSCGKQTSCLHPPRFVSECLCPSCLSRAFPLLRGSALVYQRPLSITKGKNGREALVESQEGTGERFVQGELF